MDYISKTFGFQGFSDGLLSISFDFTPGQLSAANNGPNSNCQDIHNSDFLV